MHLEIKHVSNYTYTEPVFLEPQHLYFHPLMRSYYRISDFKLEVHPTPTGLSSRVDAENNIYHQCWFQDQVSRLKIVAQMKLEVGHYNPFDFLLEENPKTDHREGLNAYLVKDELSDELKAWAKGIKEDSHGSLLTFLGNLCTKIHDHWDHEVRYESSLHTPDQCFHDKKGSCRDLSWMLVQILRNFDLPARFVSGYSHNPELGEGHELHAWVEAWVHGAGWVSLDPSSGLYTTETYIPVCTSYHPLNTSPMQGTYRGAAKSSLDTSVNIQLIDTP